MTALILILSQISDWKNFWWSTFYFLRSIHGQSCNWCCWDWWCWFDQISCNARWPHGSWFCHRFLIERIFGGQLFISCGQFTVRAVIDVVETAGVDLTEWVRGLREFFFLRFSSWQVLPIRQTNPQIAIIIRTPEAAAKVVFCSKTCLTLVFVSP